MYPALYNTLSTCAYVLNDACTVLARYVTAGYRHLQTFGLYIVEIIFLPVWGIL